MYIRVLSIYLGHFKVTQNIDVLGEVADYNNPFLAFLEVINSTPVYFVARCDPQSKSAKPRLNLGRCSNMLFFIFFKDLCKLIHFSCICCFRAKLQFPINISWKIYLLYIFDVLGLILKLAILTELSLTHLLTVCRYLKSLLCTQSDLNVKTLFIVFWSNSFSLVEGS